MVCSAAIIVLVAFIVKIGMLLTVALRYTGACGEQEPPHNSTQSPSSYTNIENFVRDLKENYLEMDVLPDEDWPPSIGRHESNLVVIEHGRDTLPGAKETKEMQRNYVKGNVDDIKNKRKDITYNELFSFLKEKSKSKFRMLIDGAPGVGKTTLCRKFCKDWAAGQILKQFSFVWLLNMREERIANAKSPDDLFQHYDKDLLREVVQLIKKTGGEGNLLVCDGFDELSEDKRTQCSLFLDIIRGKELPKCSVIVSSRPYASQMLQQMNRITHHVEIVGFTEEQIKQCFMQNITDKPKAEELIEQLKQRLDILSLCYTPLSAAIMLYVYKQEEYTLPTTLTKLYTLYALHSLKRSVTIHFENLCSDDITDLKKLPDPITLPFKALCEMAYNGLQEDQLEFSTSQLPQSLQGCPECKGTKPDLLGFMSGSKSFTGSNREVSYQFTHLTVQEFLAAWYAAIVLSAEEQGKLFIEKACDDRFRMMLLFLAGITGLQDTQVYQQILLNVQQHNVMVALQEEKTQGWYGEDELQMEEKYELINNFLLFHLIYESQNYSLSPILASSLQLDGNLELSFKTCDLFKCRVVAYFLSTSKFSWKRLQLDNVTDQQMEVMHLCSSDVKQSTNAAHPPHFLKDTQDLRINFDFDRNTLQNSTSFLYLHDMKLMSLSLRSMTSTALKYLPILFKVLKQHTSLKKLEIELNVDNFALNKEVCEALQFLLKTRSTSFQCLKISDCSENGQIVIYLDHAPASHRYSDSIAAHIAAGLLLNQSLKKLDICLNNITSVGATKIFRALVNNTTLESLNMSCDELQSIIRICHWVSLPTSSSKTTSHDRDVCTAMEKMLSCNSTLTELNMPWRGLSPKSCMTIFHGLKHNSSLKKLDLSGNTFDQHTLQALTDMLPCNNSLTELSIAALKVAGSHTTDMTEHIAVGLAQNHSVKRLDISKNEITSVGAVNIFRALVNNTTLESLHMSFNMLQSTPNSQSLTTSSSNTSSLSPPSQLLAQPTPALSTTNCLPLSPSPTPHDGGVGAAMADMLSHNSTLTELNLSERDFTPGLTPQSYVSMFKAVKHNSSLKKLDTGNIKFDQAASEALADMLSCNHSLTELYIECCDCQPKALARGLLHNTTLTKVTVSDSEEKDSIMAALKDLRREEEHTQKPDPEVVRCEQVLRCV